MIQVNTLVLGGVNLWESRDLITILGGPVQDSKMTLDSKQTLDLISLLLQDTVCQTIRWCPYSTDARKMLDPQPSHFM